MTHTRTMTLALALFALGATAPGVGADELTSADRSKLKMYLTHTHDLVLKEVEGLTDAQWSFKQAPDRWSVAEVVEHLALTEPFLFELYQKTMARPAADAAARAGTQGKDETMMKTVPDRSKKFTAAEPLQPANHPLGDRAAVMAAFKERRAKTLEHAAVTKADLRAHVSDGPLGPMDGYQWLLYIGAHNERHLGQIREVKADTRFPKANEE